MMRKRARRSSATSRFPPPGRKTIAAWKALLESQHWVPREEGERMYEGLRKAGMPEG